MKYSTTIDDASIDVDLDRTPARMTIRRHGANTIDITGTERGIIKAVRRGLQDIVDAVEARKRETE